MRAINTNVQSYEEIILHDDFYIDKTALIREWWENRDWIPREECNSEAGNKELKEDIEVRDESLWLFCAKI